MIDRNNPTPRIAAEQLQLLERLCNACAVSGYEYEVRRIVLEQVRPLADEVRVDALGNVLAIRRGAGENRLRVMVAAHMDEVGLMLTEDDGAGLFAFEVMGGVNARQLAGKPVLVGREHVPGVIGTRPVHFDKAEGRGKLTMDALRVDVGPANANRVQVGECATFATRFAQIGPSLRAKALDDRLGVTSLIELLRHAPPNIDLLAAFTVQEELGLRGAHVAAYTLDPDLALVLDCTPANDMPAWDADDPENPQDNARYNTRVGQGPAIYIADRGTLGDPRLVRHLITTAEECGLPYQIRQPGGGGTDAAAIHKQRAGIPSISLSVPGRYLHTAASMARLEDWQNTFALAYAALSRLSPELLAQER